MIRSLVLLLFMMAGCSKKGPAEKHGIAEPCIRSHTYTTFISMSCGENCTTIMPIINTACDERATVIWYHGESHKLGEIWPGAPE